MTDEREDMRLEPEPVRWEGDIVGATDRSAPDYTEIRDDRIRGVICKHMSEMLDNPDEHGIYPTSRFMWKMETFILAELGKARKA